MNNTIETQRLLISTVTAEGADFILELVNTPEWITFIGDKNVKTVDDARAYIDAILSSPNLTYWIVRAKERAAQLGIVTVIKREYLEHHDIGFAFLPQHTKKGYAVEAAKAVLAAEVQSGRHTQILATTLPENQASIVLLRKLGLAFEKEISVENKQLLLFSMSVREE